MKKKMPALCAVVLCIVFLVTGCAGSAKETEKTELHILAAASMTDVLTEVAEMYREEEPDITLTFTFDSSGTLKTQIEQGAPADVFLSAAMKQMEELEKAGLMDKESVVKLLENKVVLIKPVDSDLAITSFEDVANEEVAMAAIGNADVPVGQYAEEIYTGLGIWKEILAKSNLASNVRQVLDWVATGNADCGIVYATDAKMEKNVVVVSEAPEGACSEVIYPAGIVKASRHAEEADAFLRFLQTEKVKEQFEKYGFTNYEE